MGGGGRGGGGRGEGGEGEDPASREGRGGGEGGRGGPPPLNLKIRQSRNLATCRLTPPLELSHEFEVAIE